MALREILRYPDPRLRQVSERVTVFDDDFRRLVADMTDTMYAAEGAGLAAIQVGVPKRLFIVDAVVAGRGPDDPPLVFANPEILTISDDGNPVDLQAELFQIVVDEAHGVIIEVRRFPELPQQRLSGVTGPEDQRPTPGVALAS